MDLFRLLLFLIDKNGQVDFVFSLTVLVGELASLELLVQIFFLYFLVSLMLGGKRSNLLDLVVPEELTVFFEQAEKTLVNFRTNINKPLIKHFLSISGDSATSPLPVRKLEVHSGNNLVFNLNIRRLGKIQIINESCVDNS